MSEQGFHSETGVWFSRSATWRRLRSATVLCLAAAFGAPALADPTPLTTIRVINGLTRPLFVTAPPGDLVRLFIVEQRDVGAPNTTSPARIKILNLVTGQLNPTEFLVINGLAVSNEQGLLGLAFHPNYAVNGYFYINYVLPPNNSGISIIARYKVSADNPDVADPASEQVILRLTQPNNNHNGGWLGFGPDGYLYCTFGDGGSQNDPGNRGQDITNNLLGKILRLDVNGPDGIPGTADDDQFPSDVDKNYAIPPTNPFVNVNGDDEIWAYGLRNPWRVSFDRLTGDLWIGDVGQDEHEEIDFQPAGAAGRNYGWRCMEGFECTGRTGCECNAPSLTLPIHTFDHPPPQTSGPCSVTGGYVYRGCAIPDLRGTYFFADYCSRQIWSLRYDGATVSEFTERTTELDPPSFTINSPTSFGEDGRGELYIVDQGGEIFKIVPNTTVDCDDNGTVDYVDIAVGTLADCNCNGIPDTCNDDGAPRITTQPAATVGCTGRSAALSVVASGTGTLGYQWRKDGQPISGATAAMLTINPVAAGDAGSYSVVVTDSCGSTTSDVAALTVQHSGDPNCDGTLNNFDIDPFIVAIVDGQAAWESQYGCNYDCANDFSGDGLVNNFDIEPFVAAIVGSP